MKIVANILLFLSAFIAFSLRVDVALSAPSQIAIVVAKDSKITQAAPKDLESLYLGKIHAIGKQNAIVVEHKDDHLRKAFHLKVTGKSPEMLKKYWARKVFAGEALPPTEFSNDAEIKSWLSYNLNGIGYIDHTSVDSTVKVIGKLNLDV